MTANWERDNLMFSLRDPQPEAHNLRVQRNSLVIQHSITINVCTAHSLSMYRNDFLLLMLHWALTLVKLTLKVYPH